MLQKTTNAYLRILSPYSSKAVFFFFKENQSVGNCGMSRRRLELVKGRLALNFSKEKASITIMN